MAKGFFLKDGKPATRKAYQPVVEVVTPAQDGAFIDRTIEANALVLSRRWGRPVATIADAIRGSYNHQVNDSPAARINMKGEL